MPELVPIGEITPSTYNPRNSDPARLDAIELSLLKLGWLFPIYATDAGEVLSGHQRHLVATRMGIFDHVPVERVKDLDLPARKAVNLMFNRATNEMVASTKTTELRAELAASSWRELAERLPDAADPYPCMKAETRPLDELLEILGPERNQYGTSISRALDQRAGVRMPVIIDPDGKVLNGIGRLRYYQSRKMKTVPVTVVTKSRKRAVDLLVNKLSMDFDINDRYADMLRSNSFRRKQHTRRELGRGFLHEVGKVAKDFDIRERSMRQRWVNAYGESVVDFGAGLLMETELLRSVGIRVSAFEPYVINDTGEVDTDRSRDVGRAFLEDVRAGVEWSTIFCSSVLNSVPFKADREHIVCILAALAWGSSAKTYLHARGDSHPDLAQTQGAGWINRDNGRFEVDYEPNLTLGHFKDHPKVMKYHSPAEFKELMEPFYGKIGVRRQAGMVAGKAEQPRKPKLGRLDAALKFEFELPMPDGQRLGLGAEAVDAFRARLAST